jgi:hypothetical protein
MPVSCWIIGEWGNRGRISNGGVKLINYYIYIYIYICVWNTKTKHPWTINMCLKTEGQEGKTGLFWGWVLVGGGGHKERVN